MSLKHGLLGLLNYGDMTGYELMKAFKDSLSFFWQAQTSQIYRELDTMEKNGWLTSRRVLQSEKPNKRVYSLTAAGKAELSDWLASPASDIRDAMRIRSAFLMRVFFAGETGKTQALSMLRAFRAQCLSSAADFGTVPEAIAAYGAIVGDPEKTAYWRITALFGEAYFRAEMEWVEQAIRILEEMK